MSSTYGTQPQFSLPQVLLLERFQLEIFNSSASSAHSSVQSFRHKFFSFTHSRKFHVSLRVCTGDLIHTLHATASNSTSALAPLYSSICSLRPYNPSASVVSNKLRYSLHTHVLRLYLDLYKNFFKCLFLKERKFILYKKFRNCCCFQDDTFSELGSSTLALKRGVSYCVLEFSNPGF